MVHGDGDRAADHGLTVIQDSSSDLTADAASELPEPSLPAWISEGGDDELNNILPIAVQHVKAKRGGDLLGIIMSTAGHNHRSKRKGKIVLLIVIKGEERETYWVRVKRQLIEILYRGHQELNEELQTSLHLPSLLRKARVLYERDGVASKICETTTKRFKQGPPNLSLTEKIGLKAECYHWLGKMQEAMEHPDHLRYIVPAFIDQVIVAWFRLLSLWPVSLSEELQLISSRDQVLGKGLRDIWNEHDPTKQVELAQRIASHVLKDVPWPARLD